MKLKLRGIKFGCDFRKSEETLWDEFRRDKRFKSVGELQLGECVVFVSSGGNQLIWFLRQSELPDERRDKDAAAITVLDSRRWRMNGSTWDARLLADYALAVGIRLMDIPTFEQGFAEEIVRRRSLRDGLKDYKAHSHFASSDVVIRAGA